MQVRDVITAYLKDEVLGGRDDIELTLTTQLVEEDIIDSLGIFQMVSFLEDRFGLEVEPEDVTIENFTSIASIEAFVSRVQGAEASQP